MKACPFCAEEIQDAALVCRHCHSALTPSSTQIWGRRIAILLGLIAAFWVFMELGDYSTKYRAFVTRRDAWHRKCDQFVGKTESEINAIYKPGFVEDDVRTCKQELDALTAYGKQQGW